jgi:hypothetical protein
MMERRTFSGRGIRYSAAAAADDNNDDRGGTTPLTPSTAATLPEMTTMSTAMMTMTMMTTTTTTTTIASPETIESTGAMVLVPHRAHRGFDVVVFTKLSCAIRKHADGVSNATDAPTYAPSSLVKDGGTTALTASSLATAVATSTMAAAAPMTATAMSTLMTSFVNYKIITLSNINL